MSFVDTLKGLLGKGKEAASQNADKVHGAIDKAADVADSKTGASTATRSTSRRRGEEGCSPEGVNPSQTHPCGPRFSDRGPHVSSEMTRASWAGAAESVS